jgi:glycerol-3-phosphate O-acyltransferase
MGIETMDTLKTLFSDYIRDAAGMVKVSTVVTEDTVYQEPNAEILPFLDKMVERLSLPGSRLEGLSNLEQLLEKAEAGASCLLFPEHYSNLDLSIISLFLRKAGGRGAGVDRALVAIAGMKLTEDNPLVAVFASAYRRLVIYPSRSLQELDPVRDRAEIVRSNGINRAAMKKLMEIKRQGKIVLLFPSGTRYRPWDPSTRRGVREVDSYIHSFDYMCHMALNGEILHVRKGDMLDDEVSRDLLLVTAGPVYSCAEFRAKARLAAGEAGIEDKKQATADAIMTELEEMHRRAEEKRRELLGERQAAVL